MLQNSEKPAKHGSFLNLYDFVISRSYGKVPGLLGSGQGISEADPDGPLSGSAEFAHMDCSGHMVEGLSAWNERVWKEELKEEECGWRGLSGDQRGLRSSWAYIDYLKFQEQKFRPRKRRFGKDPKPRGLRSDWWLFNLCTELRECLYSQRNDWEESQGGGLFASGTLKGS